MISLCKQLPPITCDNAEFIKIKCLYETYNNDDKVLFWTQDEDKAVISMVDGNMIIHNNGADIEELSNFVDVIAPVCIYSDWQTLKAIGKLPDERINVMCRKADIEGNTKSDRLSSKDLYELLDVEGLSLPSYPYFAVDYCRRLNYGYADYFALKEKCAAIVFKTENAAIINGIASKEKGFGGVALKAILQKVKGKTLFVCCRDSVKGFYEKYGFNMCYHGGYWIRNQGNE